MIGEQFAIAISPDETGEVMTERGKCEYRERYAFGRANSLAEKQNGGNDRQRRGDQEHQVMKRGDDPRR